MSWHIAAASLVTAVAAATPLLFTGLGELMIQRVGLINIGVEGVMLVGAASGYAAAVDHGEVVGLAVGCVVGGLFTLVFLGTTVLWLDAPLVLAGFAVWFIGLGASAQLGRSYVDKPLQVSVESIPIPLLHRLGVVGDILFNQPAVVYLGIVLALFFGCVLRWTRHGLMVRAVGDDPAAARGAGIRVRAVQFMYVGLGGMLSGLGGAILSVVVVQTWREGMTAGRGFIALALVLFVGRRPIALIGASYLFGLLLILGSVGQAQGWGIPAPFLDMAPYLVTVVILLVRARPRSLSGRAAGTSDGRWRPKWRRRRLEVEVAE